MKIIDESVLDRFRGPGICEWCERKASSRDPHHVHTKGAGRIDHPWNLVSLCRECHNNAHLGYITRYDFLAVVSTRERETQDAIEREIFRLRRLPQPKGLKPEKPLRKKRCKRKPPAWKIAAMAGQREYRKKLRKSLLKLMEGLK